MLFIVQKVMFDFVLLNVYYKSFYLFYVLHKKKVLEWSKFSIRIYILWDVLNTTSLFLRNICVAQIKCVWHKFCTTFCDSAKTCGQNCMKFYIQLHLNIIGSDQILVHIANVVPLFVTLIQRYRKKFRELYLMRIILY